MELDTDLIMPNFNTPDTHISTQKYIPSVCMLVKILRYWLAFVKLLTDLDKNVFPVSGQAILQKIITHC